MKKISVLAIILIFLMMPLLSLAKKTMPDIDLDAVTAQEGVTTDFIDVTVASVALNYASFGDGDGISDTAYTSAGYVGINSLTMTGALVVINGPQITDIGSNATQTRVRTIMPTIYIGGRTGTGLNMVATLVVDRKSSLDSTATGGILGVIEVNGLKAQITGTTYMYAH